MKRTFEVKEVPKVVVQAVRFGQRIQPVPANATWFVVEDTETGDRYSEHDLEDDAIAERDKLNAEYAGI